MGAAVVGSVGCVTMGLGEAKSFVPIVGSFSSGFPVGDSSLSAASFSSSSSQILTPASQALVAPSQSFEADRRRAKRCQACTFCWSSSRHVRIAEIAGSIWRASARQYARWYCVFDDFVDSRVALVRRSIACDWYSARFEASTSGRLAPSSAYR